MILTQQDIDEFEDTALSLLDGSEEDLPRFIEWLSDHPQVIMAGQFQEFVSAHDYPYFRELCQSGAIDQYSRPLFRNYHGTWILPYWASATANEPWCGYRMEALYASDERLIQLGEEASAVYSQYKRARDAGNHQDADHFNAEHTCLVELYNDLYRKCEIEMPSIAELLNAASQYIDNPLVDQTVFISSRLWTPTNQQEQKLLLQESISDLILAVQREKMELEAIGWRQFEEVVAEVLRSKGMSIHVVRNSPQGGRDILARFPFGPSGEFATIAIEVKHRKIVGRPVLQQSLYQNRGFPGLMLVTSGRFTSGVVKEASKPENHMRVFLKDGIAIRDIIASYKL